MLIPPIFAWEVGWKIFGWVDVVYEIENRIKELGRQPAHDELEALTHFVRERVTGLSAMDLYHARQGAHEASIRLMDSMSELDLVLTPTLGSDPIPVGFMDSRTADFSFETWGEKGHAFAPFAYICNVSGQPAASLPVQLNPGEHPCAVQLAGHTCGDHLILQVARELERSSSGINTDHLFGLAICSRSDWRRKLDLQSINARRQCEFIGIRWDDMES